MKGHRVAAAVGLAILAGALWPVEAAERGLRPDFLLLVALGAGILGEGDAGPWTGIASGLAVSPLTLEPFGWDAALLGAAGIAAARARLSLRSDRAAVRAGVAGALALLLGLARVARLGAGGGEGGAAGLLPAVLAGAAATAAAAPPVLSLLDAAVVFRAARSRAGSPRLV